MSDLLNSLESIALNPAYHDIFAVLKVRLESVHGLL